MEIESAQDLEVPREDEDRSLEIKELLEEVFSRQAAPATRRSEGKGEGKGEGKSWGDRDEAWLGGS